MARRYCRWPGRGTCLLTALAAWCLFRLVWPAMSGELKSLPREALASGPSEIQSIVDGRTLRVRQGDADRTFDVRLIGVTLPEREADQDSAQKQLAALAPLGQALVELDKRRLADDGTWLAYVYVGNALLNAEIVRSGAVKHDVYPGDSLAIAQTLKAAEAEARTSGRGIWKQP